MDWKIKRASGSRPWRVVNEQTDETRGSFRTKGQAEKVLQTLKSDSAVSAPAKRIRT